MNKNHMQKIKKFLKEFVNISASIITLIPYIFFIISLIFKFLNEIGWITLIDFLDVLINFILIATFVFIFINNIIPKILDFLELLIIRRIYHRYRLNSNTNQILYQNINNYIYKEISILNNKSSLNNQTLTKLKKFVFILNEEENILISMRDLKNVSNKPVEKYYFMMLEEFGEPVHKFVEDISHLSFYIPEKRQGYRPNELNVSHLSNNKNIHKIKLDPAIELDEKKSLYFLHKFPKKTLFNYYHDDIQIGYHIITNDFLDFNVDFVIYLDMNLYGKDTYILHIKIKKEKLKRISKKEYDVKELANFIKYVIDEGKDSKVNIEKKEVLICDKCYNEKEENQKCNLCGNEFTIPKKYIKFESRKKDLDMNYADILIIFKYSSFIKYNIGLK